MMTMMMMMLEEDEGDEDEDDEDDNNNDNQDNDNYGDDDPNFIPNPNCKTNYHYDKRETRKAINFNNDKCMKKLINYTKTKLKNQSISMQ